MPDKQTVARARRDKQEGKAPSTQAGEFVREEIHHVREGKHGARSAKQAVAIGLSKARRAGVDLPPNPSGKSKSRKTSSRKRSGETSATRSRATKQTLKKEPRVAGSRTALSRQAHKSAAKRGSANRHAAAVKAAATRRRNAR